MFSTHDPLKEINRAERAQEDDYVRKLEQELMMALREKSAEEIEQAIQTYTHMHCPKCIPCDMRPKVSGCRGMTPERITMSLEIVMLVIIVGVGWFAWRRRQQAHTLRVSSQTKLNENF